MHDGERDPDDPARWGWNPGSSKSARQAWSERARGKAHADSTPPLCERCWHPVLPEQGVRSYHPQDRSGPFAPLWRCFVHRDVCPPPRPTPEYRAA